LTIREREVTAALGQAIAQRVGEPRYNLWFARNTKLSWDDDQLVVGVPNRFFQEWLQTTFADAVRAAAAEVLGRAMQVRFTIDAELFQVARHAQAEVTAPASQPPEPRAREIVPVPQAPVRQPGRTPLRRETRRWRRLADFVTGPCNRVAHAAALSVVEDPGQGANPLVLYGPVGTGKTHLLEGIAAGLRERQPGARIGYLPAEEFTNCFLQAMRLGKLGAFRKQFREYDVLLLDDLQFLARKRATREEFLHTFDALLANGKQIVVACDCHPRLDEDLLPELADRLLGGVVWGLAPPDPETRLGILRRKSALLTPPLPDDVLRYLAEQVQGNVRELEGALHSVRHFAQVSGRVPDAGLAREAIGDRVRHALRTVRLEDVDQAVCRALHLPAGALQARDRAWSISHPRMLAMYLARKHTIAAYSEIGRYFGGRNHSTAVAAEKKVRGWLQVNGELALGPRRLGVRSVIESVERELLR
jgi:chromosomal replication initiator protein